ncbi:hypothetical protein [Lysobacter capsici]|uniref:hypothetical protein n=1 Tax=Lysobacter capsici TaxID=435897 RepID=UPI000627CD60|nr:hypothetical protein [Lysobacter capsici]
MKPRRIVSTFACAALLCTLGACSKPAPPEKERPVDPQATQMRDAIQQPIKQAKSVEGAVDQGAQQTRDAIDAAGG